MELLPTEQMCNGHGNIDMVISSGYFNHSSNAKIHGLRWHRGILI
jgi:hypothetical protein